MPNGTWLRQVRAVERDRGVDYASLACRASLLTPYVQDHLSQAAQGLEELYLQLPSVVAAEDTQRLRWEEGRETYVARVCEVIQHLGAALTAVGCTDGELHRFIVCEEGAKKEEKDTRADIRGDVGICAPEGESDSDTATAVELSVEGRTKVPESGI